MNYRLLSLSVLGLSVLALVTSCRKPEVEIVEQNNSYKLDEREISVDMPVKFEHNPNNLIKADIPSEVVVNVSPEGELSVPNGNKFKVLVRLKKPSETPIEVEFVENAELQKSYMARNEEFKALAADHVVDRKFTIPAGVTSHTASLVLADYASLVEKPGYVAVYSLKLVKEVEGVEVSKLSSSLEVKVKVTSFTEGDFASEDEYVEGKKVDRSLINVTTNYNPGRVGVLNDGRSYGNNWWVPSNQDKYLDIAFPAKKIAGFTLNYAYSQGMRKTINKVTVMVSNDGGSTYYRWGNLSFGANRKYSNSIIFDVHPMPEITNIRLVDFVGNNPGSDDYVDLTEVEVYELEE